MLNIIKNWSRPSLLDFTRVLEYWASLWRDGWPLINGSWIIGRWYSRVQGDRWSKVVVKGRSRKTQSYNLGCTITARFFWSDTNWQIILRCILTPFIEKKSMTIFDFWLMLEKRGFQFLLWAIWGSWVCELYEADVDINTKNLKRIMVRDGICGEPANGLKNGCRRFGLVRLVGQKIVVGISNWFYVVFGSLLAPTPNFIQIGWKTQ